MSARNKLGNADNGTRSHPVHERYFVDTRPTKAELLARIRRNLTRHQPPPSNLGDRE